MRTIAIMNQKGGVGKTTTCANLGAAIAGRAHDTCLIDMDPQSHLTLHFGVEVAASATTVLEILTGEGSVSQAAEKLAPHLCLLPATVDLVAAENELVNRPGREFRLREGLTAANQLAHEFIFIDCPPSLGLLTLNALAAADDVIIPLQPHFLALHGLGRLLETIAQVQQHLNPRLRVAGVLLCMYESVTRLTAEVSNDLHEFFAAARSTSCPWSETIIFNTTIRRNIKLAECPSHGETIFQYEPRSHGAEDYNALADEFLAFYNRQLLPPELQVNTPHDGIG